MNNTLDTISDNDFNTAVEMSAKNYEYSELLELLNSAEIVEKQIAILNFTGIKSKDDALLFASMLTGQDGKIREVTAFKLNEIALNPDYKPYFIQDKIFEIFMNGFMDINGNICRQVVNLTQIDKFKYFLCEKLPERITSIIEELKQMDFGSKQYILSKKNFQLYWNLEALYNVVENIDFVVIEKILVYCSEFFDYTIREKAAKILSKIYSKESDYLREKLKNDENFYVKRCFN